MEENKSSLSLNPAHTFLFNGDIDQNKTDELMHFLLSQIGFGINSTIILNTYGGDVYDAFGLADFMKIQTQPINIICTGKVMSSGLILLTGASKVYSFLDTRFMIHDADIDASTVAKRNIKNTGSNIFKLNDLMYQRIAERSYNLKKDKTIDFFKELGSKETYFSAEEALEWGVIDGII